VYSVVVVLVVVAGVAETMITTNKYYLHTVTLYYHYILT